MEQAWFRRGVDGLRLAVTLLTATKAIDISQAAVLAQLLQHSE